MKWDIQSGIINPPHPGRILAAIGYLRVYTAEVAYIQRRGTNETERAYKVRIYTTLRMMDKMNNINQEMRIINLWPQADREMTWENLRVAPVPGTDIATRYKVIHDIIPRNTRLHRIHMSSTESCTVCGNRDTLMHRLTGCGEGSATWNQTRIMCTNQHASPVSG